MSKLLLIAALFGASFGVGLGIEQRNANALPPPPNHRSCPYCYSGTQTCQYGSAGATSCTQTAGGGCYETGAGKCKGT
jgi:hypothetical protein